MRDSQTRSDRPDAKSPSRQARPAPVRRALGFFAALLTASTSLPAQAQEKAPNIIRDAEIEQLMREYTAPIFRAANINAGAT
ncbi:MAG: hypothetical protein RIQ68_587, partial [Pseudomonadota bacterium]